jgi:arylsulfatase B
MGTSATLSGMKFSIVLSVVLSGSFALAAADPAANLVIIIADDLGYGETSAQDPATDVPTPHLDSIAKHGIRFTNAYVTAPFCAASRAGMITGRYQTRFGFEFNPIGARNEEPGIGLPASEKTLADRLRDEAGYTTALIGKWHLGGTAPFHPLRRGYDEFYGFLHEGRYYRPSPYEGMTTWLRRKTLPGGAVGRWISSDGRLIYSDHIGSNEPEYDADNPVYRNGQPVEEAANLTDAFSREAAFFIERCGAERPFFLHLAYNAVHSPMQADDAYLARFAHIEDIQRRIFAAMLTQLDEGVGTVLSAIEKAGVRERTLVVFLSDNGGPVRELTSRNGPLRGEKGSLLEGGIRVPCFMSLPGTIPAGQVYDEPVSSLDLFPTALALAGMGETESLDGVDLIPYLTGKKSGPPHENLYWRVGPQAALRQGDWKLMRAGQKGQAGRWQLYDLAKDPGESHDLAGEKPALVEELVREWERLDAEMVPPLF